MIITLICRRIKSLSAMKIFPSKVCLFVVFTMCFLIANAQENPFTERYKAEAVKMLSQLMNDFYIFPDVAKKTELHLMKQLEEGYFKQFGSDEEFAKALTESVQSINNDKHMQIRANQPYEAPEDSPERMVEERMDQINNYRSWNLGFNSVQILDGNVGYIDLTGFAGLERGKEMADAAMKLLSKSDAIIFDLSKNGGGSPDMVQYLCSFFFDQKLHLNSLYYREGDVTTEYWTLDEVNGDKLPDVPLFVITSERTFSGAEEFSYNMQTQKRATLIGQTTGGGANPGGTRRINDNLFVFIPTGMAINPVTKTSWEGVGVVPEIETSVKESFDKAVELAQVAAVQYRLDRKNMYADNLRSLMEKLDVFQSGDDEIAILEGFAHTIDAKIFGEGDLNILGYDYLLKYDKPNAAQLILKANTIHFPKSPNVFDSYAESFLITGDLASSAKYYQIAVDVAMENGDAALDFYKQNLEMVKSKMKEEK